MANIFISYSRKDESSAGALIDDIEELGHSVWFDQDLSGGQAWWDTILENIRNCDVFIFVLSFESLNSSACKLEYTYASELGKTILPVLIGEGVSTNLLPPVLSKIQFVDYRKQDRDAVLHLAKALTALPPSSSLPDPLPRPPEVPLSYLGSLAKQIGSTSNLSYEEQSAILLDLKKGLHDPENAKDARILLEKLKERRDLLASISVEIDELLGNTIQAEESYKVSPTHKDEQIPSKIQRKPQKDTTNQESGNRGKKMMFVIILLLIMGGGYVYLQYGTQNNGSKEGKVEQQMLEGVRHRAAQTEYQKQQEEADRFRREQEEIKREREAQEAKEAKYKVQNYNGEYVGIRGYTDPARNSPVNECKARYSFDATIKNGKVSFISDGRSFKGEVDEKGNLYIDKHGISPATETYFRVTGPLNDATMTSGYCGNGYFYLQRK